MNQHNRDRRARQLRQAAGDENILTLEQAAAALDCGMNTARSLLKELMTVGASIPAISDYIPNWDMVSAAQYYVDYEPALLGKVTDQGKREETGQFMQADDEPIVAEIWPPVAAMPRKMKFHRLR